MTFDLPNAPNPALHCSLYLPSMRTKLSMAFAARSGVKLAKLYGSSLLDVTYEMARDIVVVYDTPNVVQTVKVVIFKSSCYLSKQLLTVTCYGKPG
jgi:hypothetical protein